MNLLTYKPIFTCFHKKASNIVFFIAFLFGILLSENVLAQNEGRWYSVEVLVFKRLGSEAFAQENWPTNIDLSYPSFYQQLKSAESGNFSLLPNSSHILGGFNYTLRKDNNYRVLTHQSWRQKMDSESKSPAIIISGGETINGHNELEGSITIYIARYLHVITDLWLTQKKKDNNLTWPNVPQRPDNSSAQSSFDVTSYPVATLRERRRMRSKELHYIDHPLMGVLIHFTPIEE
ncbi:MAG: hypothetical protein ACJAUP_000327 [Cellvibrionaceae bacterium]|jgi:hypothetical protein